MRAHSGASGVPAEKTSIEIFARPAGFPADSRPASEPAVALLDKRGIVSFSSPAMGNLFHTSQELLEGHEVSTLLPGLPLKKTTPGYNLAFADAWEHEATWRKLKGLSPSGDDILLEISLKKLSMNTDQYILLGMRPVKENLEPTAELHRLIESTKARSDAVMITDTGGIIRFANAAFVEKTGYSLKEAIGQPASFARPEFYDLDLCGKIWETLLAGNDFHAPFSTCGKNGEVIYEDTHIRPFIDRSGITTHFVVTSRGVNEPLRLILQRLQREAYHDALTGLPNRNLFLDRLRQSFSQASRRSEKLSLIYIDLDNFKEVNDNYGHAAGDAVLRATASSLSTSIRDEDTVVRLGGDEFALILINVHCRDDVELVSNKILLSLTHGVRFKNRHIPIRASLGASIYPDDGDDSDAILQHADFAMYSAKAAGGHRLHFFRHGGQADI